MQLLLSGTCNKSVYCNKASRNDRETSGDVVVVQFTRYEYKPINYSQAVFPTRNE